MPAIKVDWISRLPKILFMQLNRLKYETGNAIKVMSEMKLEKTIFADRFLNQNKTESEQLREKVTALRDKVKHLEKCVFQY